MKKDLTRAREARARSEARRIRAGAVALSAAGWLDVENDDVVVLGDAVIFRGDAVPKLAEMTGLGDGPKAIRVERVDLINYDRWT